MEGGEHDIWAAVVTVMVHSGRKLDRDGEARGFGTDGSRFMGQAAVPLSQVQQKALAHDAAHRDRESDRDLDVIDPSDNPYKLIRQKGCKYYNKIEHRVSDEHERKPARVVSQLVHSKILVALDDSQNKQDNFVYKQWYPENIVVSWCIDWDAKLGVEEAMEWICVGFLDSHDFDNNCEGGNESGEKANA